MVFTFECYFLTCTGKNKLQAYTAVNEDIFKKFTQTILDQETNVEQVIQTEKLHLNTGGYVVITGSKRLLSRYVLNMKRFDGKKLAHHKNGNVLNNCREYLQTVDRPTNAQNCKKTNKSSKYYGVHYYQRDNNYRLKIFGKWFGRFEDEILAAHVYNQVISLIKPDHDLKNCVEYDQEFDINEHINKMNCMQNISIESPGNFIVYFQDQQPIKSSDFQDACKIRDKIKIQIQQTQVDMTGIRELRNKYIVVLYNRLLAKEKYICKTDNLEQAIQIRDETRKQFEDDYQSLSPIHQVIFDNNGITYLPYKLHKQERYGYFKVCKKSCAILKDKQFCQNTDGYIVFSNDYQKDISNRVHIYIMKVYFPERFSTEQVVYVDHILSDKEDLRLDQLNTVDFSHNAWNKKINSKSQFRGVQQKGNQYMANITKNYQPIYLGMYETPQLAAFAYDLKCLCLFGGCPNKTDIENCQYTLINDRLHLLDTSKYDDVYDQKILG